MSLKLTITALIPAAMLLGACSVSPIEPLPVCDLAVYEQARLTGNGPFMVPEKPGTLTELPLNSVNITDARVTNKVLPTAVSAERLTDQTVAVSARIQNCTDYPLQLELRTNFYDTAQAPAEPASSWQRIYLPARTQGAYRTVSVGSAVDSYLIELREGS